MKVLITGATGLVGSHVAGLLRREGLRVSAFVRPTSPVAVVDHLRSLGVELVDGDVTDPASVRRAMVDVTHVVHGAAKVGDWGPAEVYRRTNVQALEALVDAASQGGKLRRFVMISSLGVYEPRDHHRTDETVPMTLAGFDPYTRTKAESEQWIVDSGRRGLPAVILRPGFVYGPRDRQVLPRLAATLRSDRFFYFGDGHQVLNNTAARNIAHAVRLALDAAVAPGEVFNITDEPLATRREFIGTIARLLKLPEPRRHLPLMMAKPLAWTLDRTFRAIGTEDAPLLSMARYKFLALNLDFSIEKAKRLLGYRPVVGYQDGLAEAVAWYLSEGNH